MATPRTLKGNTAFKGPRPWIDVTADGYDADPTGSSDATTAIQAAITAAAVQTTGGAVAVPAGTYRLNSGLTMSNRVALWGAGRHLTNFDYRGTGSAITLSANSHDHLKGFNIALDNSGANAKGIYMAGTGATPSTWCVYNTLEDIGVSDATLTSTKMGLHLDGSTNQVVYCNFRDFLFYEIGQPCVFGTNCEANIFTHFNLSGMYQYGVQLGCQNSILDGFWLGRGSSDQTIYGFHGAGEKCLIRAVCDIGNPGAPLTYEGYISDLTGDNNIIDAIAVGDPTYMHGGTTGWPKRSLGRAFQGTNYDVDIMATTGADRSVFGVGVSGYSNGFTIAYTDAPQAMTYQFNNGNVDLTGGNLTIGLTHCLVLRGYYLWVDATGDLRIKSSAPTTDLDGAVVGTQT